MQRTARFVLAGLSGLGLLAAVASADNNDDPAKLLGLSRYIAPQYPAMASDEAITSGYATMAVSWDDQGNPTDIVTLRSSNPYFATASTDAIKRWRRAPELAGQGTGIYELNYQINGVVVCSGKSLKAFNAQPRPTAPLKVVTLDELDATPKALAQPMPTFPANAQGKWDEAKVVVEFFVDENGVVRAPTVRESTAPEFTNEALAALKQWRFETPRKNGRPAVYTQRWAFDFRKTG